MVTVLFVSFFIMLFISVPIAVALGVGSVLALVLCSHMPLLLLPRCHRHKPLTDMHCLPAVRWHYHSV